MRWEFWPWQVVYLPVAILWFFLALKARGWVFFSAANPCMKFGGLIAYSKVEMGTLVPENYLPRTISVSISDTITEVETQLNEADMSFPLIIKPDMGERGKGVKILRNSSDFSRALENRKEQLMIQTYVDLPIEMGIMYSRHPSEVNGKITSIVIKEFPFVVGDGKSTLSQLILSNLRTRLSYKVHFRRFADRLHTVPSIGEEIRIVTIGNHMLGTTFNNGNHLISLELEGAFDSLAKQIPGFFIGRFDIRASSMAALLKGNFKVIEVNGVNSEPCHIYDPGMGLVSGISELLTHWKRIYQISIANHQNGVEYSSFSEIRSEIKRHNRESAKHD